MSDDPMNVEKMIADMNRHIAVSRRSLLEHIESGDYTFRSREGTVCSMDADEIEYLSGICTEIEKMRLRLPIFISTDISYPGGAWKVEGATEVGVISRILGKKAFHDDLLRFYHPDLRILRQKLPNSIEIIFIP